MVPALEVWLLGQHIGTLTQADGRLVFAYTPEWLAQNAVAGSAAMTPLSQSLPLQAESFNDRAARPFFAGLLPEGDKRMLVAKALHVSNKNDFGLLDGIGGDCAGAVSLLEPGQATKIATLPRDVRWLDSSQLAKILDEMPKRPMLAGEDGLRLSLAGAQDKLPVVADGNRIGLPLSGTPSSHIIKPAIAGIDGSAHNEGFCMRLAAALSLDVAKVEIQHVDDRPYLLVERYDRTHDVHAVGPDASRALKRLHQEDFCQALGIPPELKYQNEGGPDLAQCFALVRRATRPSAPHILKLLDYVVFNTLIGNHDAHAKNFSLLYGTGKTALAPLYDALSTAVYPDLTKKMAMKIGSKYEFADAQARHWEQFATAAGLSPAQVKKRILEIAKRLPDIARTTHKALHDEGNDHAIVSQIVTLIEQRCMLTIRRLTTSSADEVTP